MPRRYRASPLTAIASDVRAPPTASPQSQRIIVENNHRASRQNAVLRSRARLDQEPSMIGVDTVHRFAGAAADEPMVLFRPRADLVISGLAACRRPPSQKWERTSAPQNLQAYRRHASFTPKPHQSRAKVNVDNHVPDLQTLKSPEIDPFRLCGAIEPCFDIQQQPFATPHELANERPTS
jgi:hypothetical protein